MMMMRMMTDQKTMMLLESRLACVMPGGIFVRDVDRQAASAMTGTLLCRSSGKRWI
jgi:hypothetical protein